MKQTEITVQIFEDYKEINNRLIADGFFIVEEFEVNDFYFSRCEMSELTTMEYLDIMNNSIIVRKFFNGNNIIDQKMVFKKKELDLNGNVISEEKTQAKVQSAEDTVSVFQMAGLCLWCKIENHVYTYQKGGFKLDIHCVKDLGNFIECEEDETMQDLTSEEKFDKLTSVVKNLNLKLGEDFSCKKVFMKFKNK